MSKPKFTPGPWHAASNASISGGRKVYAGSTYDEPLAIWENQIALCCIRNRDFDAATDEVDANARLIAAAPDLYAACERFVNAYAGNKAAQLGNGQARHSLDEFRAALAKARGE